MLLQNSWPFCTTVCEFCRVGNICRNSAPVLEDDDYDDYGNYAYDEKNISLVDEINEVNIVVEHEPENKNGDETSDKERLWR